MLLVHLSPSQGESHNADERPYLRTSTRNGCLGSCQADARRSFACGRSFDSYLGEVSGTRNLPPRASFASAYDPISKKIAIFGGFNASNSLNETWRFDGTTWVQVKTSVAPSARMQPRWRTTRRSRSWFCLVGPRALPCSATRGYGTTPPPPGRRPVPRRCLLEPLDLFCLPTQPTDTSSCLVDTGVVSTRAILFGGPVRTGSF